MDDDGGDFAALGPRAQHAIDAAFDSVTAAARDPASGSTKPSPRKRRRLNDPAPPSPGGFISDTAAPAAGGFIVEDPPTEPNSSIITIGEPAPGGFLLAESPDARIPLELIPRALQALDLPPDDPDVLTIFQNAAAGWGAGDANADAVSLKDWRAVCAVLLVARTEDDFPALPEPLDEEDMDGDEYADDDDEDEYEEDDEEEEDEDEPPPDDSDDEDFGAPSRKGKSKGKKGKLRAAKDFDTDDEPPTLTCTPRQKRAARATFALFFPDVPDEQLDAQRIRIRDISRVAALLKEKITAEEIVEMLQEFSTALDKSVGLVDFEQILLLAQLV
ncbi:hypothetical protein EXIGLDRAFT_723413 [Exidia glandulosa HHB12029]|uniref:Uncharacterized protein n=1 Tax=Exidia glandulosa HHB12029 TaxID=1314781 RepID=A0A166A1M0_EXIGL|nr:hypothetical protein EXIGLDRAFT_723413 [Exidia glandulosa HHB12029]